MKAKTFFIGLLLLLFGIAGNAFALQMAGSHISKEKEGELKANLASMKMPFIENKGQADERAAYYADTFAGRLFITKDGEMVYALKGRDNKTVAIKELLLKPQKVSVKALERSQAKANYFIGNDKSKWKTDIPTYERLTLGEVYKGIELQLNAYGNNGEKLFYVNPGANVEDIALVIEGAKSLDIDKEGRLIVKTEHGDFSFSKPVAYQEYDGKRVDVAVAYSLENAEIGNPNPDMTYGFKVGNYDRANNLIIDPLLASTFLGGSGTDFCIEIALDSAGNIIVAGVTSSSDFPTTSGAFDRTYNGGDKDIFVTKINSAGDAILFSTFIGGTNDEFYSSDSMELYRFGMALDNAGNIYVTANTKSSDFPTTTGAYDRTFNGGDSDVFVTKLSSTGNNLVYSTFLGGSGSEFGGGIAVDGDGNAYVTGETRSADFPTTSGAYDRTYNGSGDIFVAKINPSGSNLIYSTYLGGSSWDEATYIAVDSSGNAYVLGGGGSANYPTTAGAFAQSYKGGEYDIYLTKLNSAGSGLVYSTFLGGNDIEWAERLVVDNSGNAYVTGNTHSSDFPVTPGAYDTTFDANDNGCYWPYSKTDNGFITKINSTGSGLSYSTFLSKAFVMGIRVDGSGNAYVTGATCSSSFPTTPNAVDTTFNGVADAIIAKINPAGNALLYSSYMGGSATDYGLGIAIDSLGNIYITGITDSVDFPTQSPIQSSYGGGLYDAFVAKIGSGGVVHITPPGIVDFDGDGKTDVAAFHLASDQFFTDYAGNLGQYGWGGSDSMPLIWDYDGDGKTDISIYHIPTNQWFVEGVGNLGQFGWGGADSVPVPGDYNGDGQMERAFYHSPTNRWFVEGQDPIQFGWNGAECIPVPGDYDGDGKTDMVIYHLPSNQWFQYGVDDLGQFGWGGADCIPVPGDYNGDGKTEIAVYHIPTNQWFVKGMGNLGQYGWGGLESFPIPGDYDGDGVMERGFYRPDANWWFIEGESDFIWGWGGSEFMPITSSIAVYNWFRFMLHKFD